jgi:thioredoxin reductase
VNQTFGRTVFTPEEIRDKWYQMEPVEPAITDQFRADGAEKWATVNKTQGTVVFSPDEIRETWYDLAPLPEDEQVSVGAGAVGNAPGDDENDYPDPQAGSDSDEGSEGQDPGEDASANAKLAAAQETPELLRVLEEALRVGNTAVVDRIVGLERRPLSARFGIDKQYSYSSTQVQLPAMIAERIRDFGLSIPQDDVYAGTDADPLGRETDFHVTVKYGLMSDVTAADVQGIVSDFGPVFLTLGETAVFSVPEYDVLYIRIVSDDLARLNALISQRLPNVDTHPQYIPHATIAYLQPGCGVKYAGRADFVGETATCDGLLFSTADGEKYGVDFREDNRLQFLGSSSSGNYGHAGRKGQVGGSSKGDSERFGPRNETPAMAADREKFTALKLKWAQVNDRLLDEVDTPDSAKAQAAMDELKGIVQEMHGLHADPGGLEGVGLPGGTRDMVVVGAGPGGLSASIMGATDGLDTLVIDANAKVGGQSQWSSRIENYPGFLIGVTGEKLAGNMFEQATRLGAESKMGVRVVGMSIDPKTEIKTLELSDGSKVQSRSVIIAGGIEFSQLSVPGNDAKGIVYQDGKKLAAEGSGEHVAIIGGSNAAAQAALGCAKTAASVTVISRSPIEKGMSDYQVQALRAHPKITILEGEQLKAVDKDEFGHAKGLTLDSGKYVNCRNCGVFIGGKSNTSWIPEEIKTGKDGKLKVNGDLATSMKGVFAVGDMRVGSIGRIGAAVGDGQMAAKNVWGYFKKQK